MSEQDPYTDIAVLIPAYNPGKRLVELVTELLADDCRHIIVVDDGSDPDCGDVFRQLRDLGSITICEHATNEGKGAALKTGFECALSLPVDFAGVITADADGQHLAADIRKVAAAAQQDRGSMALGCRSFDRKIPLRSLFGNRLTAILLRFAYGIHVPDTQTGLRYLPRLALPVFTTLSGNAYEFELQCLIKARDLGIHLRQVPIATVYIDGNASSHFMPIRDSYRIYAVLFRFTGSSALCFAIDIGLFALVLWAGGSPMVATIFARIVSGVVNFSINKLFVFRRPGTDRVVTEAIGYLTLWLTLMIVSGLIVSAVEHSTMIVVIATKILVDVSLFILSYYIQSRFVFERQEIP